MAHFEKKCSIGANVETKFNALWKKKNQNSLVSEILT